MKELERIVELLASNELTVLGKEEIGLIALAETYAKKQGFNILKEFIELIKAYRVDVNGRRRNDLRAIALAMKVNVFAESRLHRATPTISSNDMLAFLRSVQEAENK